MKAGAPIPPESIRALAVIGAGQMGSGIAQVAAASGFSVRLFDSNRDHASAAKAQIGARFQRLVDKGQLSAEASAEHSARVEVAGFDAALADADFVIEAATENRALKLELFRQIDAATPAHAVLASNTSSLSITLLAGATRRPGQVLGMHFMNPVPLMQLVELVRGLQTSSETLELGRKLALRFGKTVIVSQDSPGFLVNRVLIPLINEACFALQEGVGTPEDIDLGVRLGLNHPMGPLELADLIGLDTVLAIAEVLQQDLGDDKYRPATLLRNRVAAGWLGKKTRRGFYAYDSRGEKLGGTQSRTA